MKKLIAISLLVVAFGLPSVAQVTVSQYAKNTDGIVYFLPKKSFVLEISYTEKTTVPGIYSDYAYEMLGIENVIKNEKKSYNIEKISLTPFVEPDQVAKYIIKASETSSKNEKESFVSLNSMGLLCGIGNATTSPAQNQDVTFNYADNKNEIPSFNNFSAVSSQFTAVDTTVRIISFDTSFYKLESLSSKSTKISQKEKAENAVTKLLEMRQNRIDLLTGYQETNYESGTIKYMDNRLLEIENAYLSMFTGYTTVKHLKHTFVYSPDASQLNKEIPILCFSTETGLCNSAKGDSSISFLAVSHTGDNDQTAKDDAKGLKYRVPVTAEIYIKYKNAIFAGGIYEMPQFGTIQTLDTQRYKSLSIDPNTGAVINAKVE
ncbi:MAG: DUF4831 family protein [Bacteroidales bacterium]|nr:DUF4831 family protein [Bacteroidales bacterium]